MNLQLPPQGLPKCRTSQKRSLLRWRAGVMMLRLRQAELQCWVKLRLLLERLRKLYPQLPVLSHLQIMQLSRQTWTFKQVP